MGGTKYCHTMYTILLDNDEDPNGKLEKRRGSYWVKGQRETFGRKMRGGEPDHLFFLGSHWDSEGADQRGEK